MNITNLFEETVELIELGIFVNLLASILVGLIVYAIIEHKVKKLIEKCQK